MYGVLKQMMNIECGSYYGIEWNNIAVLDAQKKNLNMVQGDLNKELQFPDNEFKCVFGLSVLEHLLNPCHYLKECYRIMEEDASLIILTPKIST